MEAAFRWLWVLLALFALGAHAECSSFGVDYANGGTYNIDQTSNQYFSFATIFQGCNQESIQPVLVGPDGSEYACSAIKTTPAGQQVTSTCGIPFSAMKSGSWKIIVAGNQLTTQRTITLKVGSPQTVWVTATPTVVIGVTITARATTVVRTSSQTQTLILVPATVTAACGGGGTRTVTNYPQGPTITVTSTVVRTETSGQVTSVVATTVTTSAVCHYPSHKRDLAAAANINAVAAVTSTYTETTYTVTSTVQTTVAGKTATELVLKTVTTTITPAASTVCQGGGGAGVTVTVNRGTPTTSTNVNIVYRTTKLAGTVWVGSTAFTTITNQASATACWRAGGWFG